MARTHTLKGGKRTVHVVGAPRRIAGGYVVTVAWSEDDVTQKLRDGSVHPAHRAGFSWEEPASNIDWKLRQPEREQLGIGP